MGRGDAGGTSAPGERPGGATLQSPRPRSRPIGWGGFPFRTSRDFRRGDGVYGSHDRPFTQGFLSVEVFAVHLGLRGTSAKPSLVLLDTTRSAPPSVPRGGQPRQQPPCGSDPGLTTALGLPPCVRRHRCGGHGGTRGGGGVTGAGVHGVGGCWRCGAGWGRTRGVGAWGG